MTTELTSLLNATEAAQHLRLSKSTLAKLRLYGTGPEFTKLGRRVVYRLIDLEEWVSANKHSSTSEYHRFK